MLIRLQYFTLPDVLYAPEPVAQGYAYDGEGYKHVPLMDLVDVSGAGSVVTNVIDYTKWINAWLNSAPPISKKGYEALKTPRTFIPYSENEGPWTGALAYSLGWQTGVYQGYQFYEHAGGMNAFGAELIFFPALNYGLVAFGNTAVTSNAAEEALLFHLIDEKLGVPEEKRFGWNKK